ncbi:MAG: AAC(3) family N-acetyltransferase [Tissierellia bacterium]|nr:AAC(3) family N-acetyltransferase [Tissierellia bacterium]
MPVFNYNFPRSKIFNVQSDVSEIGVINEHFRKSYANWQTPIPIFSFAGTGTYPVINENDEIDPFDEKSIFGYLHNNNSLIMYYGAMFSSTTFIHYVERVSGLLSYRYDKYFNGKIITKDCEKDICLKYHVRPMGKEFNYDWIRLENDLINEGLLNCYKEPGTIIKIIRADILYNFWIYKITKDRLYFLDKESKMWIEPLLDKLGRSFLLSDFEQNEEYN